MGHYYLGSLTMNTMGYVSLLLALCLLSTSAAPAPFLDPVSLAFTTAGGLALTAGTSTITIPTSTLLLGKAIGVKVWLRIPFLPPCLHALFHLSILSCLNHPVLCPS